MNKIKLFLLNQYANIGGQAVIEGVMMRSPNTFVVAVRKPDGKILIRQDQWFGLSKRLDVFKRPFLRGILVLIETMANGIVSLNYSANIAMDEEMKQKALEKGKTEDEYESEKKKNEKVGFPIFITILISFLFGIFLFVFLPHALTITFEKYLGATWGLDSMAFHSVDGIIKAFIFMGYVGLIGLLPDVRRVFQYHGAEHKSISTFEAGQKLTVDNAREFTTVHPRCGTSFVFFLLFISIILFSIIFVLFPVGQGLPFVLKHVSAILFKIFLMLPIAGISYELIKWAGKNSGSILCRWVSKPGMMLQKLTTREPEDDQLEVALASIKTVLLLEEEHDLKSQQRKILSVEEFNIDGLGSIRDSSQKLEHFLEN